MNASPRAQPSASPAWLIALALGASLTGAYGVLPYGPGAGILYGLATLAAAGGVAATVWRHDAGRPRQACLLIGVALVLAGTGHAIWYGLDLLGREPFPSWADAFYLAVYPLFILALWLMGDPGEGERATFVDASIVGVATSVLGWALLIKPYLYDAALTWLQLLVATAYPVGDLMVLPFAVRLLVNRRLGVNAPTLLLLGVLAYLAADLLYGHGNAAGWYAPGGLTDGLWLVAYTLFVAAAWHPVQAEAMPRGAAGADRAEYRVILMGTASALMPLVILLTAGQDVTTVRVGAVGAMLVFLLVMVRLLGLVRISRRQQEQLARLAQTDPLTGAVNRRYLDQVLAREIARCGRTGAEISVGYLDLDHFKRFNDTRGHASGDSLLREAVAAWRGELRGSDVLARIGGEEFVVVLPDSGLDVSQNAVERLRRAMPLGQTCSAGVAAFRPGDSCQSLLARADAALYRAKRGGRNCVVLGAA